ncbi:unnamed protein product [Polarella glacialis]|uniref:RING-type domain-containing protein n=1 Tax=Polarella glacialis TaxID=89957 RepID=A0A813JEW5_POLGL|nr:unnamed protein product [Polarella glacialis]
MTVYRVPRPGSTLYLTVKSSAASVICVWRMYLWGRPAEEFWGSGRRVYVGHLNLAYVLVGPPGWGILGLRLAGMCGSSAGRGVEDAGLHAESNNPDLLRAMSDSIARFQLLHAFIVLTLEELLEWPLDGGRRATLVHLAAVLRGITTVEAGEVLQRAQFPGTGCPLCLDSWEEMPGALPVVVLSCGHAFCEQCLARHVPHQERRDRLWSNMVFVQSARQPAACPSCRRAWGPPQGHGEQSQPLGEQGEQSQPLGEEGDS